jgi:hypothetical protein
VSPTAWVLLIVKAAAPEPKTILFTSMPAEIERFVRLEEAKVAISLGPLGTVAGVQFAAVFQRPLAGLAFQVALPANEWAAIKHDHR